VPRVVYSWSCTSRPGRLYQYQMRQTYLHLLKRQVRQHLVLLQVQALVRFRQLMMMLKYFLRLKKCCQNCSEWLQNC